MSKPKKDIKEIFHELYSYKQFGKHTTNKSLQKKIEKFRNQMAVDFYNLDRKNDDQIEKFSDKYVYKSPTATERIGPPEDPKAKTWAEITTRDLLKHEQHKFKITTNKAITGRIEDITESELERINYYIFHTFKLVERIDHYKIQQSYFTSCEIYKGLYEWVILVSQGRVDVGRCEAEDCEKIFVKNNPGSEQLYCSKACKMREYRRRQGLVSAGAINKS